MLGKHKGCALVVLVTVRDRLRQPVSIAMLHNTLPMHQAAAAYIKLMLRSTPTALVRKLAQQHFGCVTINRLDCAPAPTQQVQQEGRKQAHVTTSTTAQQLDT